MTRSKKEWRREREREELQGEPRGQGEPGVGGKGEGQDFRKFLAQKIQVKLGFNNNSLREILETKEFRENINVQVARKLQ